jgi:hypothetical protein
MTLWLLFYFVVIPWITVLCVLGRRPPATDRQRTRTAVLYALSLALHAGLLAWVSVVGIAFSLAWGGGGSIGPFLVLCSGLFLTCLGHVGVLMSLARATGNRFRVAAVVTLPLGWLLAAGISIAMAVRAPAPSSGVTEDAPRQIV